MSACITVKARNLQRAGSPNRLSETGRDSYDLYDDEFALSVKVPGFNPEDIDISGRQRVQRHREDEERGDRKRNYR